MALRLVAVWLPLVSLTLGLACSSGSGGGGDSAEADARGSRGGASNKPSSSSAPVATGGSIGLGSAMSNGGRQNEGGASQLGSGSWAEDTPNGMVTVSKAQADAILGSPSTACAGWAEEPEGGAAVIEFIVDNSGSMLKTAPSTKGESKWVVTQRALYEAINDLPASLSVGLTFFPNMRLSESMTPRPTNACVNTRNNVAIAQLTAAHRKTLLSAVDGAECNSSGATPTYDAYSVALEAMKASKAPGDRYLVLITDGQPTQTVGCVGEVDMCKPQPTAPVVEAISAAFTKDSIRTFVVGSPGSEANYCTNADVRDWLSTAAREGGTDEAGCSDKGPNYCHFDLSATTDFGKGLTETLSGIAHSVVSCDYAVPDPPEGETIDIARVNMLYRSGSGDYQLVLPAKASDCTKGWHFTDDSLTRITVCKETCDLLQSDPTARVNLVFGCTQEQIQLPLQ